MHSLLAGIKIIFRVSPKLAEHTLSAEATGVSTRITNALSLILTYHFSSNCFFRITFFLRNLGSQSAEIIVMCAVAGKYLDFQSFFAASHLKETKNQIGKSEGKGLSIMQ